MAHINFLESKRFEMPRWEWNYLFLFSVVGGLLLIMITYGLIQKIRLNHLQHELTMSQQAEKTLGVSPETALFSERVVWAPVMHAIADAAARSVRLTSIKASAAGSVVVDVEGEAAEVQGVAQFRDRLSRLPLFSKVLLLSSEEGEVEANKRVQRFHVQGWLKGGT